MSGPLNAADLEFIVSPVAAEVAGSGMLHPDVLELRRRVNLLIEDRRELIRVIEVYRERNQQLADMVRGVGL